MRGGCYSEYHQAAYGNSPYGLRPWKGIDIMTIECSAIQCFQTLDLSPALRAEILECGEKIAPLLYPKRIVAQPLKGFDGEGLPVAGGQVWNVDPSKEGTARGNSRRRESIVYMVCVREEGCGRLTSFSAFPGAILRDSAFFLWATSLPVYLPPGE